MAYRVAIDALVLTAFPNPTYTAGMRTTMGDFQEHVIVELVVPADALEERTEAILKAMRLSSYASLETANKALWNKISQLSEDCLNLAVAGNSPVTGIKRLRMLLTQAAANPPTGVVLENQLADQTLVLARTGAGVSTITGVASFGTSREKLIILMGGLAPSVGGVSYRVNRLDANTLEITTYVGDTPTDTLLDTTELCVDVYPG